MRASITLALLASVPALPQAPSQQPTFTATTKLVQVSVIAQDQAGKPVADMRREDFQILDNGAPREIRLFVAEKPAPAAVQTQAPNTFTNQIASQAGSHSGYSVVLFDNLVSTFGKAHDGGTSFGAQMVVRTLRSIPDGERIALYAIGWKFQVVREFTMDRESLERQMRAWTPAVDTSDPEVTHCDSFPDPKASAECARIDMQRRVAAFDEQLKQLADHLAGIPGRKNVIWMANRFPILGGPAIQRLMDAQVAIYPVDEIGAVQALARDKEIHSAPLRGLAALTGGVAFFDRDDLDVAVREAMDDGRVSYTLGFYQPGEDKATIHRLAVRASRPGVTLRYRTSYETEPRRATPASPVTDLVQAMNLPTDTTAIPITASVTRLEDRLDLKATIDLAGLDLQLSEGLWRGQAEIAARFLTVGAIQAGEVLSETASLKLSETPYEAMLKSGFVYHKELAIPAKAVELKLLVANLATGKIGTLTIPLPEVQKK